MFTKINFLFFVFFVFVLVTPFGFGEEDIGRVARKGQFPFVARLYSKLNDSWVMYCTASIISRKTLLTAGHCCQRPAMRFVVSGDPDQSAFNLGIVDKNYEVYPVKKVIVHPEFERTDEKLVHDLCLLILHSSLQKTNQLVEVSYSKLEEKKNCTALGWGSVYGYKIQHGLHYKRAIGYKCDLRFGNSAKYDFVCLEPHSVCPGDSGGPLLCEGKLYGVASFFIGHGTNSVARCEEGVVDYYVDITSERKFIEQNGFATIERPSLLYLLAILFLYLK